MIEFSNVTKKYTKELFRPNPLALKNVSFFLPNGNTMGLIGANGAGKSTAIRLMMDFIRPDSGKVSLFGSPLSDSRIRKRIGYLPETASFPSNLTILDLIRFVGRTCQVPSLVNRERSEMLLKELGLWEARNKRFRQYSKGMQQRANFVLALLNDPDLLILDEPMSGLDPMGRIQIIDLIGRLKDQGKTILFCSHILDDVDRLVDFLLVLDQGRVLYSGTPEDFLVQENKSNVEKAFLSLIRRERGEASGC